jgi:hypothetical protein
MDELEQRLRSALTAIADEVPESRFPWVEHQRRLTAKRGRRSWQMVAVAAAVMALIAVPVVVLKMRPDPVQAASPPDPRPTASSGSPTGSRPPSKGGVYQPQPDEKVVIEPVTVTQESAGGVEVRTMAYVTQRGGQHMLCVAQIRGPQPPVIDGPAGSSCSPANPPRPGKVVWASKFVLSAQSTNQMIYLASDPTESILVRTTQNTYAVSSQAAQGGDLTLLLVYLGSGGPPSAYTARDRANTSLENG